MVITNNGKPIALLTPISDENLEETIKAMRRARAENAVLKMRIQSVKSGRDQITENEIEKEIRKAREERA